MMRYENINKPCRQSDHELINLIDHTNVWYCIKCHNIMMGNGKSILPCNYEFYVKLLTKMNEKRERNGDKWRNKIYSKEEIDKWIKKNVK